MNTLMVDIVKRQFCVERVQSWWENFRIQLHFRFNNEYFTLEVEGEDGPTVASFVIAFDTSRSEYLGMSETSISRKAEHSPV